MPSSEAPHRSLRAALRGAALRSVDLAYHQGRQALSSLEKRTRGLRGASEQVAKRVVKLGERAIAKSPLPIPQIARDALGHMHDALVKLDHGADAPGVGGIARGEQSHLHKHGSVPVVTAAKHAVTPVLQPGQAKRAHPAN